MFKWVFTLAAGLYAGFVIYGQPSEIGGAEAATSAVSSVAADRPVVLASDAMPAEAIQVTRAAAPAAPLLTAPAPEPVAAPSAFAPEPRLIGEPVMVSLVEPAAAPEGGIGTVADAAIADAAGPLLRVTGSRVNMRSGPSTADGVVDSLPRGTVAEAIGAPVGGWQEIRDVESGLTGFMSSNFLEPA